MVIELLYKALVRPFLFQMDAEEAHGLAHRIGQQNKSIRPLLASQCQYPGNDLSCTLAGIKLKNPIGLAAGFDKNGDLVEMLGYIGFGFAEIGSVTAQARAGNPKARLFRLPEDNALINRLGLNGEGADHVSEKLKTIIVSLPIGLNIAKTNDPSIVGEAAIRDMLYTFQKVKNLPLSYIAINASCPNTEEGIMTETKMLSKLFEEMQTENIHHLPLFVKLSPDSPKLLVEDIVKAAKQWQLAGYVCGNTSTSRSGLNTARETIEKTGNGGLSGPPLKRLAIDLCRLVFELKGPNQTIIGCGGISSGQDAYDFICNGASVIQLYTGLIYEGPTLPKRISQELSALLRTKDVSLSQAVGSSVREKNPLSSSTN